MGFWDRLTGQAAAQFLDVIQWLDGSNDTIVYRFPIYDQAITDKSKVIVREGQAAVFIAEGQLSDVFAPGTYTLDTPNSPILSFFKTIAYGMNNPYKGDILFVNTKQFADNGWGTPAPIPMRDPEFGPVRVRAFGNFSYRVTDPAKFIRQIVGTDGLFTTDEINGQLKKKLVSEFAASLGQSQIALLDLVGSYPALGDKLKDIVGAKFEDMYGLSLTDVTVVNVGLPPEVEKALDERSKMGVLGNLDQYTKLKAAEAIGDAAKNQGMGGAGMGMGVGMGMGNMMAAAMSGMAQPHAGGGAPPPPPGPATFHYHGPSGQAQLTAAQIAEKVAADRTGAHSVWAAGWPGWKPWAEVPEIAGLVPPAAPPPPPMAPPPPAAAAPPPPPAAATFHYNGPGGAGEKSLADVVAAVKADPGAAHHVWQPGWPAWKGAAEVPEIAAQLGGPPPAP